MCCCWYCQRNRLCWGRRFYVDVVGGRNWGWSRRIGAGRGQTWRSRNCVGKGKGRRWSMRRFLGLLSSQVAGMGSCSDGSGGGGDPRLPSWSHGEEENKIWWWCVSEWVVCVCMFEYVYVCVWDKERLFFLSICSLIIFLFLVKQLTVSWLL